MEENGKKINFLQIGKRDLGISTVAELVADGRRGAWWKQCRWEDAGLPVRWKAWRSIWSEVIQRDTETFYPVLLFPPFLRLDELPWAICLTYGSSL